MADLTDTADPSSSFPDFSFLIDPPRDTGPIPPPLPLSVEARKRKMSINLDELANDREMMLLLDFEALLDDKQSTPPQRIDPIVAQLLARRYIQEHGSADIPTTSADPPVEPTFDLPFGDPPQQQSHLIPPFAFEAINPSLFARTDLSAQHAHTHRPALFSNAPNPGVAAATAALDSALFAKPAINTSAFIDLEGTLERSTPSKGAKRTRESAKSIQPTAATAPSKRHKSKATKSERSSRAGKKSKARVTPPSVHLSLEERRQIRAERNRASAERSRLRHKQRTEELERDVYNGRIENREVKAIIDTYYVQLRGIADTIEKGATDCDVKAPALYEALDVMKKVIDSCTWTYKEPRDPEIPLKTPRA